MAACFFFFGTIVVFVFGLATAGFGLILLIPWWLWGIVNTARYVDPATKIMQDNIKAQTKIMARQVAQTQPQR